MLEMKTPAPIPGLQFIKSSPPIERPGKRPRYRSIFKCLACGNEVERDSYAASRMKSCGCLWLAGRIKHGEARGGHKSKIMQCWTAMRERCMNPTHPSYAQYGGRGISICREWLESSVAFMEWAKINGGLKPGTQIDRIDCNGNYEPGNCRFVSCAVNARNRRYTKLSMAIAECVRVLAAAGVKDCDIVRFTKARLDSPTVFKIRIGTIWKP